VTAALHPEAERLLAYIAQIDPVPMEERPIAETRERRRQAGGLQIPEPVAERVDIDLGGVPGRLYRPEGATGAGVVFLHGGGWVLGDLDSHENVCCAIANRSGATFVSVDYRLAPEHPFPAAYDDSNAAATWVAAHLTELGIDGGRLAVMGDSAGGNLAAAVALAGDVTFACGVLVYPVTDLTCSMSSYDENAEGYFLTKTSMQWFIDHYLGAHDRLDPRASPFHATDEAIAAMPPSLVITAGFDPLRDEGEAFTARMVQQGVPVTIHRYPGMFHGFVSLAEYLADGKLAWDEIGQYLRTSLA
jgi:acetyl esterase